MCKFEGCTNKAWKNGYCYTKHRKLANSALAAEAPVVEVVAAETCLPKSFVCEDIVLVDQIIMAPNQIAESVELPSSCVYTSDDKTEKQINAGLFEQIFDMKTGGPCLSNLKMVKEPFFEKFDHNKLAFILNNLDSIKEQYRPNARDSLSLDKYYERSAAGNGGLGSLRVKYFQNGANTIRGRYQATDSLSGQNMVREVRHTIFNDYYVDMDMDNCHPVITVWMCNKLSVPCEFMADYVANREKHIRDIIAVNPDQTREDVKQLFLSINYGGKDPFKAIKNKTPFLESYMKEAPTIKKAICARFKYFKEQSDKRRKAQNKNYNLEGAAMSHVCCFVENQLLMYILDYLKEKVGDVSGSILCFDGIMIRKELFKESFLGDIKQIFADLGIPIKMSVKDMKPLDLTQFGFDPAVRYTFGKKLDDGICLDKFDDYELDEAALTTKLEEAKAKEKEFIIYRELLELLKLLPRELLRTDEMITSYEFVSRDDFTLRETALLLKKVFGYIYNNGNYFIIAKAIDTIRYKDGDVETICYLNMGGDASNAFKQVNFNVRVGESLYSLNLKRCLVQCAKGIMYRNADVIPHSPLEEARAADTFNLFGKYQHQYDPSFVIDEFLVALWTNHVRGVLAASNVEVGEYLLNWFAHLLQRPHVKTSTVPLVKGTPGCGKNLALNVFQRYVMNPSLTITCPDMDKLFSRFNSARMGKVMIVLDEAVDSCNRQMNNKMKNFITEERVHIEQKGKDIIEVSDFSNYFIITNNDFASIIEKNDRRYLCLIASDHRVNDHAYFDHMVKLLLNVDAGRHIFHWLLRRDISDFNVRNIPTTTYKKELSARQTDNVVKWLLSMHEKMLDSNDHEERSALTKEWHTEYLDWCRSSNESKSFSLSVFTNILNKEGFTVRERKASIEGVRKTIRPRVISREILERNLSDYITLTSD